MAASYTAAISLSTPRSQGVRVRGGWLFLWPCRGATADGTLVLIQCTAQPECGSVPQLEEEEGLYLQIETRKRV